MSIRYSVFTVKRELKLKRLLVEIDNAFKTSTNSTFTKVYGKSAIIELAVFIEESIKLLCERVTKGVEVENKTLFDTYKKDVFYIQPVEYSKIAKRLFPVYGIKLVVDLEKKIGPTDMQTLKTELGNINSWRQTVAHSDIQVPASPDVVLRSFNRILPILRKVEVFLRSKK